MSSASIRILLVEDDRDLAAGLSDALDRSGFSTEVASDGESGLARALTGEHALVILDAMLPELSGFDVLARLRKRNPDVPLLMLTAKGQETDKVRGLRLGADDYVTKPFGLMELMARVEALLRRADRRPVASSRLETENVVVDFRAREARKANRPVALTSREFQILELLSLHRGQAVSREALIAELWGTKRSLEVSTRTVDQHIAALRRKLGDDPSSPHLIETVYGFGYRLTAG